MTSVSGKIIPNMFRISVCVAVLVVAVRGQMAGQSSSSLTTSTATVASGYPSPSSGSYYTTPAPSNCQPLPTKPSPVGGGTTPTSDSFTSTSGIPFDFISGISIRQLNIVRNQTARIFQMAAQAAFVNASEGAAVYGSIVDYIQSLWYPNDARKSGLPYTVVGVEMAGPLGGGSPPSKEPYWESSVAQSISTAYGRSLSDRLDHLLGFNPVGYARIESDITYRTYLQYRSLGNKLFDVTHIFLHRAIQQTAAADYVLGPLSDEVHSALKTVFRYINWHEAISTDLYEKRIYQRYEGLEDDPGLDISYLDLTQAELQYPIPVNSSAQVNIQLQATDANRTFGPVTPAGTARASSLDATARMFSDRTTSGPHIAAQLDLMEGKALKVSAEMFPHPQPADGSTPLIPAPYSAAVNKSIDRYTGISNDQLVTAYAVWRNMTRAAAVAAGVNETDGVKIFAKQAQYTFLLWHSEYSAITGYLGVDDIWNSAAVDQAFATSGSELDRIIVGICQNNNGLAIRTIDRVSFRNYRTSRALGQSWFTLAYHAFNVDAQLEAAQFFLGDALNDEAYSALESLLNFIALKEYQVYHSYNNGYRLRPFADYNEFVGPIFSSLTATTTVDRDVDPTVPVPNTCAAPGTTPAPYQY